MQKLSVTVDNILYNVTVKCHLNILKKCNFIYHDIVTTCMDMTMSYQKTHVISTFEKKNVVNSGDFYILLQSIHRLN